MAGVAREGDSVATGHLCDTTTTLDTPSQTKVFVEGALVACQGDLTVTHNIKVGDACVPHVASISGATSTVKIGGISIAKLGDACDAGSITSAASTVFIG